MRVARCDHALIASRLYLPEEWVKDPKRRKRCGIPKEIRFQTRHELALAMLQEHGGLLPHRWIAGDDEMGRSSAFRRQLRALEELYLLAVPSNTSVRDLEGLRPPYAGRGPHPKSSFQRVDRWCASLSESDWTRIDVRDSEKGPLFLFREARRGKNYTPAVTVPFIRTLLDILLRRVCNQQHPGWDIMSAQRKTTRKELARFYHYKKRNLLPPPRLKQRR